MQKFISSFFKWSFPFCCFFLCFQGFAQLSEVDVLVFSKTAGFRHGSISAGQMAFSELSDTHGFRVEFSEDAADLNPTALDTIEVVVFLNTSGDILSTTEQMVFQNYIEQGGGYLGIHAASDTEYDWPWYGELVGSYFNGHPEIQMGALRVENSEHPATNNLPGEFTRTDEWYNFATPFPSNLRVLLTIDEESYTGGNMGSFHPISWYHEVGEGRSFYTAMGHTNETYSEPLFLDHLLGALEWVSKQTTGFIDLDRNSEIQIFPNPATQVVHVLSSRSELTDLKLIDATGRFILRRDAIKETTISLDISELKPGYYALILTTISVTKSFSILVR